MLLICATHGDETIGIEVAERLKKTQWRENFDLMLGNPLAYEAGKRFIDTDLNRIYPGNSESDSYEEKRAAENLEEATKYNWVLDIHETEYCLNTFIIVPDPENSNEDLIRATGVEAVILWPSTSGRKTGPIAQCLENAVEVEVSNLKDSREEVVKKATGVTINLLEWINGQQKNIDDFVQKKYKVYGKLSVEEYDSKEDKGLKDFTKTKVGGEEFVPLFTDQYLDKGIKCYKMEI